jgi:hypothetical protein
MNIMAIRGGGSRGVIVTRFLIEIENITGKRICELFDYIGGSSVGCLIASGMLMSDDEGKPKYTAKDMHDILLNNMKETFSWTYGSWLRSGFGLFGSSYTNVGLLNIINNICGETKLGNLLQPIIFPAYDRISHKAYYFERDKDKDLLLKDVIMSCTAAPTYFPSHKMEINGKTYDMVDGGIVINNTVELAFLSATKNMTCIDKSKILELNIGTGLFENNISDSHGLLTWVPVIVTTLMHACNENELYELSLSLPPDNYRIFDVPLNTKYYSVDDIHSTAHYIEETEKWITNNKNFIREFCMKLMLNKKFDITDMCKRINEEIIVNDEIDINQKIVVLDNELCDDNANVENDIININTNINIYTNVDVYIPIDTNANTNANINVLCNDVINVENDIINTDANANTNTYTRQITTGDFFNPYDKFIYDKDVIETLDDYYDIDNYNEQICELKINEVKCKDKHVVENTVAH